MSFQIFNAHAYKAFVNTLQQQVELFNTATNGAILYGVLGFTGDKNEQAAFESIASLVGNRDPLSTAAQSEHALSELLKIDIKVGWGIPNITYTNSKFDWTKRDPAEAGTLFGNDVAQGAMAYMLNSALVAFVASVDDADVTFDGTAGVASLPSLNLGVGKFGDRQGDIRAWVMHSKSLNDIYGTALANSANLFEFGTIKVREDGFGRPLIMTDSDALHFDNAGTENYFQLGIVEGGISIQDQADTRTYKVDDLAQVNPKQLMTATGSFGLGIKGVTFSNSVVQPDDADLALVTNWARTTGVGLKDTAGVRVVTL